MIALRALPGKISNTQMHEAAGEIGNDAFDSYLVNGTYVIRRSCQTLPCFVIYY